MIPFDQSFRSSLLAWFDDQSRELPWRGDVSAYATLVSELMLQQTRVDTVVDYFRRWMERFPDVTSLAEASEDDVLNAWQGLGYYRRARALHRAARVLLDDFDGVMPRSASSLRELPGVGPYTAGAIASIAFDEPEPAIDGNVFRVLSRLWNDDADTSKGTTRRVYEARLRPLLRHERAGDFNQALIELGALVCRPSGAADCASCPVQASCAAKAEGTVAALPVKKGKTKVRRERRHAAIYTSEGEQVLVARRHTSGLLGGLWEFPMAKVQEGGDPSAGRFASVTHRFSHIAMTIEVGPIVVCGEGESVEVDDKVYVEERWIHWDEIADLPLSTMMAKVIATLPRSI